MFVNVVRFPRRQLIWGVSVSLTNIAPHNYHGLLKKTQVPYVVRVSVRSHDPIHVSRLQTPLPQRRKQKVAVTAAPITSPVFTQTSKGIGAARRPGHRWMDTQTCTIVLNDSCHLE